MNSKSKEYKAKYYQEHKEMFKEYSKAQYQKEKQMKKVYKIYVIRDPETKEIFYVGQTGLPISKRKAIHVKHAKLNYGTEEYVNKMNEYISKGIHPELEVIEETDDHKEALALEEKYIKEYSLSCNLINMIGVPEKHDEFVSRIQKGKKKNSKKKSN